MYREGLFVSDHIVDVVFVTISKCLCCHWYAVSISTNTLSYDCLQQI